jgi:hypothetical protein
MPAAEKNPQSPDFSLFQKKLAIADCLDVGALRPAAPAARTRTADYGRPRSAKRIPVAALKRLGLGAGIIAVCGLAAALVTLTPVVERAGELLRQPAQPEAPATLPEAEYFVIDAGRYPAIERYSRQKTPFFYFSEQELLADMQQSRLLMKQGSFNQAVLLLNRMYHSNAPLPVREKADFLRNFVRTAEPRQAEELAYADIATKPYLYYAFAWKVSGRVENLRQKNDSAVFTLAVREQGPNAVKGLCDVLADERLIH